MTITGKAVLATGANRGVGQALVKATTASVAQGIFDGVDLGQDETVPDAMSQTPAESWRTGTAKTLGHRYSALLDAAATS